MNKEQVKEKIKELVEKYKKEKDLGKLKSYSEEETKIGFILPLFQALGWDITDKNEVSAEEHMKSRGRVDFGFYLNNLIKFYLEAKPFKADLDKDEYAKQAIRYSWHKGINYAVLTDFESVKVFYAMADSKNLLNKLIFELPCEEFISDFETLWLLSRESFINNALDKYAEKHGKKKKKLTVNDKLFNDLKEIRKGLTDGFGNWDKTINKEDLEEGVQRIVERLMFIRVLEDKGLEDPVLMPILHEWENNRNEQLFPKLITKFRELDDIYNSSIFKKHACEDWEEYGVKWNKIFSLLYGSEVYEYDFKDIPADVLGGVYESYLSYIAQNPIEIETDKESGKLFKTEDKKEQKEKSRKKRKEQGIFYTPRFIVDYIVENTVGKKLGEVKSMHELKQIKILDPACGSGSFLTKALEVFNEKYIDFGNPGGQATKSEILLSNIYGVDLDPKAVELAKLNLLVETLDKKAKLPDLTENIRVGNSLISGEEKELEKYFGKDWRDKKPFNWEEEFKPAFKQGGNSGFDVIIGNPPYVRVDSLDGDDKNFWSEKLETSSGKYDLYYLFIEKSINLLREGGLLGFIVPNKFCVADSANNLRELIFSLSSSCKFFSVSKIEVFKAASNYPVIIILEKGKNNKEIELGFAENEAEVQNSKINNYFISKDELNILPSKIIPVNVRKNDLKIVIKLIEGNTKLSKHLKISEGLRIPEKYEVVEKSDFSIVKQYQFEKYSEVRKGSNISEENLKKVLNKKSSRFINSQKEKILIAEDALFITATLDTNKNIPQGGVYFGIKIYSDVSIEYLLALLNSRILSFVYKILFGGMHMGGGYLRYRTKFLEELPIKIAPKREQKIFVELVSRVLGLNKQFQSIPKNSEKWNSVKREIEKTDKEIDQKVYDLYGLTEEERKVIENN